MASEVKRFSAKIATNQLATKVTDIAVIVVFSMEEFVVDNYFSLWTTKAFRPFRSLISLALFAKPVAGGNFFDFRIVTIRMESTTAAITAN
jgi:hypothetical protein